MTTVTVIDRIGTGSTSLEAEYKRLLRKFDDISRHMVSVSETMWDQIRADNTMNFDTTFMRERVSRIDMLIGCYDKRHDKSEEVVIELYRKSLTQLMAATRHTILGHIDKFPVDVALIERDIKKLSAYEYEYINSEYLLDWAKDQTDKRIAR